MLDNVRVPVLLFPIFIFDFSLFVLAGLDFFRGVRWTTLLGLLVVRLFSNRIKLRLHWLKLYHLLLIISLLWGHRLLLGRGWRRPCRFLLSLYIVLVAGLQRWILMLLLILWLRVLFSFPVGRMKYARNHQILAWLWSVAARTSYQLLGFVFLVWLVIIACSA